MRTDTQVSPGAARGLEGLRRVGKALADVSRLRILAALDGRELCVCHLIPLLGLDPSTVSRHVGVLREAGLVAVRKEGRWLHCRRAEPGAERWAWIDGCLRGSPEVERDAGVLDAAGSGADCC